MSRIAFIGGTGPEGEGLAYRFALAGHDVLIGSRSAERAEAAASVIRARTPNATVRGGENADVADEADLIVLAVPYDAQTATLPPLLSTVAGKAVISTGVPMSFDGGNPSRAFVPEGSVAEQAQALLPASRVVAAFQNLGAGKLWDGDVPLDQDVIICGDDADAKRETMELAEQIRGLRAIDGGPLAISGCVEWITVLLVGVNKRHKALTGVRIVGL